MAEAGVGFITLKPDFSKFSGRDITRGMDPGLDQTDKHITGKLGNTFKSVAALGGALLGVGVVVDFTKGIVSAASDMNETLSKSNTVFGSAGAEIEKWASTAAQSFGQSQKGALDAASTFGNMFVQLGVGAEEAAKMSKAQTELASDFASFYNKSPEEAIQAMTAAYRGEYDAVQLYVPTINAAAVEQKALEMGLAGTTKNLTAQDKALATQTLLLEGAGDALGDFDRTSGGLANTQRTLSGVWEDTQAVLGQKLLPVVTTVAAFLADNLPAALDFAGRAFGRISETIGTVRDAFDTGATFIRSILDRFRGDTDGAATGVSGAMTRIKGFIEQARATFALVFEAIKVIVSTWVVVVTELWDRFGTHILEFIRRTLGNVQQVFGGVLQAIQGVLNVFIGVFTGDWSRVWNGVKGIFGGAWDAILGIGKQALNALNLAVGAGLGLLSAAWSLAWNAIKTLASSAWEAIKMTVAAGVKAVVDFIVGLPARLLEAGGALLNAGKELGQKLIKGLMEVLAEIPKRIADAVGNIKLPSLPKFDLPFGDGPGAPKSLNAGIKGGGSTLKRVQGALTAGTYVTSTYRTPAQNASVGGSPTSYHMDKANPATDIGGSTSALNLLYGKLKAMGGWRELLWKVKGHYDHIHAANTGGFIPGGGPDQDSVMAMLTPGEFVFSRTAVKAIGAGNLAGLHNSALAGFNAGGFVPYIKTVLAETPRDQWLRNFNTQFGNLVRVFESGHDVANGAAEVIDNMFGNTGKLIPTIASADEMLMRLWATISDGDDVVYGLSEIFDNFFGNTNALVKPVFDALQGSVLDDVNAANRAKQQKTYDTGLLNAIGPDRQWGTPQDMSLYDEQLVGSLSGGSSRQWGSAEDMAEYDRKLIDAISGAVVAGVRQTVRTG